jgi:hypothetical protein
VRSRPRSDKLLPHTEPERGRRCAFGSIRRSATRAENRHERFSGLAAHCPVGLDGADAAGGWLALGTGGTRRPCRTCGAYRAGRTNCSNVAFVPLVAFLTGGTLRSLGPLSASLTLRSWNALQTLRTLRTGGTLRAGIALRPGVFAAACQRQRDGYNQRGEKLHGRLQVALTLRRPRSRESSYVPSRRHGNLQKIPGKPAHSISPS